MLLNFQSTIFTQMIGLSSSYVFDELLLTILGVTPTTSIEYSVQICLPSPHLNYYHFPLESL